MCGKCKELIECPTGEKRISVLLEKEEGSNWAKTTMVVDRDPAGKVDAFITAEVLNGAMYSNIPFDINYCPFCGRNLRVRAGSRGG